MDRWGQLNLQQKAQLLGIYASKGYTDLASIINHYNTFQAGGYIKKEDPVLKDRRPKANFYQRLLDANRQTIPDWEYKGNVATHKMSYATNEDNTKAVVYPEVQEINGKLYDFTDPKNKAGKWDALKRAIETGDTIQMTPAQAEWWTQHYKEFYPSFDYATGGSLGHITSLGQWQYPHEITTIPSNNITMKGVDYPVIGVSDTGDTKYMLPDMDYLFDGNYVTEYPLHKFQRGGNTDGISSGRWVQVDGETVTPEYSLPPVIIEAEHPLWSLSWYKDKKNNPNINRYKDQLYNNYRIHNETGKEYLKRVAGGLSVMALPIGGAAGFILGVPDLATDFVEMTDKPSVSNATELTLDAPTRYGTELDNALISVLKSNKYTKPLAKILQYNDALQYIGAANDALTAVTGKSIIERVSK